MCDMCAEHSLKNRGATDISAMKGENNVSDAAPRPSALIPYVEANPVSVLVDDDLRSRFFSEIEKEVDDFTPDLSTATSRKAIASLAYKIAQTKTAIDKAGKKLNEEATAKIKAVNDVRRESWEALEKLQQRVRNPLTKWEEAEEERAAELKCITAFLSQSHVIQASETSESLAARIIEVEAVPEETQYAHLKATALETLKHAHANALQIEAERAELERLRAAEEERKRTEEAAAAERQRIADEKAGKEREEREARERAEIAAARAKAEAEAKVAREAAEAAQKEAKRLADEKAALERAEADRIAEERRKAVEEEKRQQNIRHRSAVIKAAKNGLMKQCDVDEEKAESIITAITQGLIPNVTVNF